MALSRILLAVAGLSGLSAGLSLGQAPGIVRSECKADETVRVDPALMAMGSLDELAAKLLGDDEGSSDLAWAPVIAELAPALEESGKGRATYVDLADRRGLGARAQYCDRRISLSAAEPRPEGRPELVPTPLGTVILTTGLFAALVRRRR